MTRKQEYLAHDLTDDQIEICQKEAERLQRESPWTDEDTQQYADYAGYTCWLDLVLDVISRNVEKMRGMYCAEMGGV